MTKPTVEEVTQARAIEILRDALWDMLDDMGKEGCSVCLAAKIDGIAAIKLTDHFEEDKSATYEFLPCQTTTY